MPGTPDNCSPRIFDGQYCIHEKRPTLELNLRACVWFAKRKWGTGLATCKFTQSFHGRSYVLAMRHVGMVGIARRNLLSNKSPETEQSIPPKPDHSQRPIDGGQ
jgi:hypothetical protein